MEETGLDQHFMVDRSLIKKIIGYSELKEDDTVLEIGPGKGFLTKGLVKKCRVIAVEKDESFKPELSKLKKINKNLEIVFGNALKLIKSLKFNKIVSNIPYNISEPLFKQLLKLQIEYAILTVSESFAERLLDKNSKIGLQTSLFFNIEKLEEVSREAFLPRPRTDSTVLKITPKKEELTTIEKVLKKFTLLDDKKTKNALMESLIEALSITKRQAKERITKLNLPKQVLENNSDLLSFEEFKKLKGSLTSKLS
ncbi:MAG: rRNA adenine N-6-methyltransferase family protein [Nanoarchaeota archaeon]|nr:rRNA adenine N-6-methyltransferase family protein [Nanoarchaeota archaeon]